MKTNNFESYFSSCSSCFLIKFVSIPPQGGRLSFLSLTVSIILDCLRSLSTVLNAVMYLANLTTMSMFISEGVRTTACCRREPGGKSSLSLGRQPSRRAYVSLGLNQEDRWSWSHCSQAGQHNVCHPPRTRADADRNIYKTSEERE